MLSVVCVECGVCCVMVCVECGVCIMSCGRLQPLIVATSGCATLCMLPTPLMCGVCWCGVCWCDVWCVLV